MLGHGIAHDAQTQKTQLCHEKILAMRPRVLVTKRIFPEAIALLDEHAAVDYEGTDDGLTTPQLIARARGKQAIVAQITDPLPAEVLAQLVGVGLIANVAVGYDNVDLEAATRH